MNIRRYGILLTFIIIFLIAAGCSKKSSYYQGYIDSKLRFISSNFPGLLIKLDVIEGTEVKKDQPLFQLEPLPEKWSIDEALSKIVIAKAQIEAFTIREATAEQKYQRRVKLKVSNFTDQEELDATSAELAIAKEQLNEAKANLAIYEYQLYEAQWSLTKKQVKATVDATVYDVFYYENEIVPAERPVLSLLVPEDIKVIFFVPEKEVSKIRLGQTISVSCDGCKKQYEAKISFISAKSEFTPPVIYSEEIRDKLVFLVEARSDLATNKELHPGQPVTVKLRQ